MGPGEKSVATSRTAAVSGALSMLATSGVFLSARTATPAAVMAAGEWMRHFYRALRLTCSPAKALRRTEEIMGAERQRSSLCRARSLLAGDWRPLP